MTGYEPTVWVDNAAEPRLNADALNKIEQGIAAAGSQDSPTFTGNVTLPSTTTIGTVSPTELGYLDGVTSGIQSQLNAKAPLASPALTGTPTTPTAAAGTNTTQIASTAYVRTEVANIVNSAPATLDTLNEIAQALGSDPNFATTMTNLINTKAPSASPTFTGTVVLPSTTSIGTITSTELGYLDGVTSSIQTQLGTKAPSADPTFTGTVTLPTTTSIGNVSSTELGYLDGVTSAIQTQLNAKVDEVASTDNAIVRFDGAGGAVQNSSATLADDGSITATYFNATSNAAGTNYKVGDDAWIGDVNWANTIRITGVTEPANGYLIFGNGDSTALGRAGTGALTYGGNTIWHAGNDGSGSGLDADLLDGNHASAFALSSHTHTIANITSLQTTLDAKAPLASPSFTGTVTMPNVSITQADSVFYNPVTARSYRINPNGIPTSNLGDATVFEAGVFPGTMNNKLWFYDTTKFTFEYTNNGTDWITQSNSTTEIKKLLSGAGSTSGSNIYIPYGAQKYRITIRNDGSYVYLNHLYAYWSTNGHQSQVAIWKKRDDGAWTQHTNDTTLVSAWPAHLHVPFWSIPWSTASTGGHYNDFRIEFTPTWNGSYPSNNIGLIYLELWGGYPAGKRTIYDWDYDKNVTFPNNVSIPGALTLNGKPAGRVHVQSTAPSSPANGDLWVDTSTPTWIAPTLLNSWANYGGGYNNAGYMKDALGFVHLRGLIKNGNIATIFNLPSGYRPVGQCLFFAPCNHTPTPPVSARIDIIPSTGAVNLVSYETLGNNAWVSLDGIMFATF